MKGAQLNGWVGRQYMGAHPSFSATQTQTNSAAGGGTLTPSVSQFHFSIDKQSYGFVSPPVPILPHQKKNPGTYHSSQSAKGDSFVFLFVEILAPPSPQIKNKNLCTIICRSILDYIQANWREGGVCGFFLPTVSWRVEFGCLLLQTVLYTR